MPIFDFGNSDGIPSNVKKNKVVQQLWLVRFSRLPGHWGLWIPFGSEDMRGTMWDLRFEEDGSSSAVTTITSFPRHGERKRYIAKGIRYNINRQATLEYSVRLEGAKSTWMRMDEACKNVFRDWKYHFLDHNCQTFAVEMLKKLRRWDPSLVSQAVINKLEHMEFVTSRIGHARRERQNPGQSNVVHDHQRVRSRPHFTSLEEDVPAATGRTMQNSSRRAQVAQSSSCASSSSSDARRSTTPANANSPTRNRATNSTSSLDGIGWALDARRGAAAGNVNTPFGYHAGATRLPRDDLVTQGRSTRRTEGTDIDSRCSSGPAAPIAKTRFLFGGRLQITRQERPRVVEPTFIRPNVVQRAQMQRQAVSDEPAPRPNAVHRVLLQRQAHSEPRQTNTMPGAWVD